MAKKLTYVLAANSVIASLVEKIDDETTVLESVEFSVDDVPAILSDGENAEKSLAAYGLSKLLQDRTSPLSADEKLDGMSEVMAYLKSGVWRLRKEGGASKKAAIDPIFAQAIAEIKGVSVAAATMALQGMDSEARKAMRQVSVVKDKIEEIRQEAAEGVEGLLDDLLV